MSGNVWEWCLDDYIEDSSKLTAEFTRENQKTSANQVFRGGSLDNTAKHDRTAIRGTNYSGIRSFTLGFRLALVPRAKQMTENKTEKKENNLTSNANTGNIILSVNPPGMNIYLDGKFISRTESDSKSRDISKRVTLRNISAGEHQITISNKHAKPSTKSTTVTVGRDKTIQVPELNCWLPDTTIILKNGSRYTGRLTDKYDDNAEKIAFRHSAGISTDFNRSNIKEIIPLDIIDDDIDP